MVQILAIGLPIIEEVGVAHKIDFREGNALPLLDQVIQQESTTFSKKNIVLSY